MPMRKVDCLLVKSTSDRANRSDIVRRIAVDCAQISAEADRKRELATLSMLRP